MSHSASRATSHVWFCWRSQQWVDNALLLLLGSFLHVSSIANTLQTNDKIFRKILFEHHCKWTWNSNLLIHNEPLTTSENQPVTIAAQTPSLERKATPSSLHYPSIVRPPALRWKLGTVLTELSTGLGELIRYKKDDPSSLPFPFSAFPLALPADHELLIHSASVGFANTRLSFPSSGFLSNVLRRAEFIVGVSSVSLGFGALRFELCWRTFLVKLKNLRKAARLDLGVIMMFYVLIAWCLMWGRKGE